MNGKRLVPEFVKAPLREPYRAAVRSVKRFRLALKYGMPAPMAPHFCPVCGRGLRRFEVIKWDDTMCVFCGSPERHRMAWSFLLRRTDVFDGRKKNMLHIAPEPPFEAVLSKVLGDGYVSADLLQPNVRVRVDITDIPYPADFFDVIYCSHVLEHVPNDRKAMQEFARVLKPRGWAIIMVPHFPEIGKTFEDFSVIDPAERLRLFGQEDHVRIYGDDFVSRLENAGFEVRVIRTADFLSAEEIARFNITKLSGDVFLCTKPQGRTEEGRESDQRVI
jgi:predicted SAM-dependent methyltransferase